MESLHSYLKSWNTKHDTFGKLQGTYLAVAICLFLLGGVISLIQPSFGQVVAFYGILAALTFVANGVLWALIKTFALPRLESRRPTARKK